MRRSRFDAARLRSLDPAAWTALLDRVPEMHGARVTAVEAGPVGSRHNLSRYALRLAGVSDPITLIGKETSRHEALFYRDVAPQLSFVAPNCWFSDVDEEDGWIVIDDVPNDRPTERWTSQDVEEIVGDLAYLHAMFWEREEALAAYDWLPNYLGRERPPNLLQQRLAEPRERYIMRHGEGGLVSDHALRSAGRLGPALIQAAHGLSMIRDMGGWRGVLDEPQLAAVADLLDDPLPMLEPLRALPSTLIHGNPSIYHWHLTLFDERRLLDWFRPSVGPGICDLVGFIQQFDLIAEPDGRWRLRGSEEQMTSEQTIVDSYLLRLSADLGTLCNTRDVRQALPAARCLFVLTEWFPQFAAWFSQLPNGRRVWRMLTQMSDEQLATTNFSRVVGIRPYLARVFKDFLQAYRLL